MVPGDTDQSPPPKYRDKDTARFADGERVRRFQAFARQAYKRLEILEAAKSREDLMALPSYGFEALGGDRRGQYSIRINQQWRICFEWLSGESAPYKIEITDYH
jgi:proteic killer suppression protein